jgi:hypothetical protein
MRNQIIPWIFLAFLGASVVIAYLAHRWNRARMAAWAEFASRHGMHADKFHIEGSYEGYPLTLRTERRGSGKHSYTVTVLRLSVGEALPPEFSLKPAGLGSKVLRVFGKRDAEIGDEEFDKRFTLEGVSEKTAEVLHSQTVQQHLYELVNLYRDFHIRDGGIETESGGIPATADALEELTGPALMLAHTLEEAARRTRNRTMS